MNKREKIMIGAAISVVGFIFFYMFVYQPKEKQVLGLQGEIKTVVLEIERIAGAIPGLRKLEEEVTREQKRVLGVRKTMSGKQQVKELLRQLAGEASRLDMDVISLRSREELELPHKKSRYEGLNIVMNIQCPYRHLCSYLKRLEELPGLITVDEIEIIRDNRIFPKVKAKLTLSAFVSGDRDAI